MGILGLEEIQVIAFFLIFWRVSGVVFTAPILGSRQVPPMARIGLSAMTALILYSLRPFPSSAVPTELGAFLVAVARELGVGMVLGFAAQCLFAAVEMAGQAAGFQMGLGVATMFDPSQQTQLSTFAQFQNVLAILLFISLNGHHLFIEALFRSYDLVGPGGFSVTPALTSTLIAVSGQIFVFAVKLAGPIFAAIFMVQAGMGLLARAVPQINIFALTFSLTILMGLTVAVAAVPFLGSVMASMVTQLGRDMGTLLALMR